MIRSICTLLQFNAGLEKNKLFLRGLPLTTTKSELEELFGVVSFFCSVVIPLPMVGGH